MPPCPRSLESLEQATRVLREELEEAQGALREWQEQNRQRHIPQKKKTRDWLRPSKSWRERSPSRESGRRPTSRPCSSCGCRRTSCRGTCGTWRPNVGPRLTGSGSFQRKALYRLPGTPASNLLWEERLRDQTEKLLCQESGASGPRGRLPLRLRLAGQLFWALAKALFLALLGPLVLGPLCALLSHQPCPPPARPWLYMRPKEMQPP
ncbi:uncharacterized protein [Lepidochelys kempii]|uniref:uncharacterized protein isoform X9 n=1 Tax=Lepidochelys kempii TaxID=8472 RepID=UPI003C6F446A